MNLKIHYLIAIALSFLSCTKENVKTSGYSDCLVNLVMKHVSLDEISSHVDMSPQELVKAHLMEGINNTPLNLTMNEVLHAFEKDYKRGMKYLSKHEFKTPAGLSEMPVNVNLDVLKRKESAYNDAFQDMIHNILYDYIVERVEITFRKKYSLLNLPRNIWNHFFGSEEKALMDFQNMFNENVDIDELRNIINSRVQAWTDFLMVEHQLIGVSLNPLENSLITLDDYSLSLVDNPEFVETFQAKNKKEVSSFTADLIWSFSISIILMLFIMLLRTLRKTNMDGTPKILNLIIGLIIFVACFFLFDYKAIKDESVMEEVIYTKYADHIEKQNLYIKESLNNYIGIYE